MGGGDLGVEAGLQREGVVGQLLVAAQQLAHLPLERRGERVERLELGVAALQGVDRDEQLPQVHLHPPRRHASQLPQVHLHPPQSARHRAGQLPQLQLQDHETTKRCWSCAYLGRIASSCRTDTTTHGPEAGMQVVGRDVQEYALEEGSRRGGGEGG